MEIKRFLADNVREGMLSVRSVLGADAVILSNRRLGDKIEILATNEFDAESLDVSSAAKKSSVEVTAFGASPQAVNPQPDPADAGRQPLQAGYGAASQNTEGQGAQAAQGVALAPAATSPAHQNDTSPSGDPLPRRTTEMNRPRQSLAVPTLRDVAPINQFGAGALTDLQQELGTLKSLLVGELAKLRTASVGSADTYLRARMALSELGLNPGSLDQLMASFDADVFDACEDACSEWQQLLKLIGAQLIALDESPLDAGGIFAVIGSTGVGKTTTVAKLAARYALKNGRDSVALITTDAFKMGGQDQLMTLGKLLNLPVQVAVDADALTAAVEQVKDKQLVLIDSAGMSDREVALNRHLSRIQIGNTHPKNLLIVSATSQLGLAEAVVNQYDHSPVTAAVLTKTDEALNLGSGLSTLLKTQLPLAYVCHGQGISDIRSAKISSLLSEAFAMMKAEQRTLVNAEEGVQIHA